LVIFFGSFYFIVDFDVKKSQAEVAVKKQSQKLTNSQR
jgi:hypothetical protein